MLTQLAKKATKSDSDWSASKGPKPGARFRDGTPPAPRAWHYFREDMRAFDRWERKVSVWRLQVAAYMPANDAAMTLLASLKGKAEEELESCDLATINCEQGIDNILNTLRSTLQTRTIYQKRRFIHEFEHASRFNNESIRAFVNRYQRIERPCGKH